MTVKPDGDLRDLYQEVILDHNRKPRNFGKLEGANRKAEGHNPLCGDRLTVYLDLEDDRIRDIKFEGSGCAISKASASMMTSEVKGKTVEEAETTFRKFHRMVTQEGDGDIEELGKLAAFSGVREFPVRVKCASLPWHTMEAALHSEAPAEISTE
ncbi:MAG TPA: SUF system NifU family Fe-S cluster assembly protein [Thermoanaerobaculia bacterium]|nr:SUF system NifU family Fe-S cluster assembly protein [Thermoanaerobaculia bacterium]